LRTEPSPPLRIQKLITTQIHQQVQLAVPRGRRTFRFEVQEQPRSLGGSGQQSEAAQVLMLRKLDRDNRIFRDIHRLVCDQRQRCRVAIAPNRATRLLVCVDHPLGATDLIHEGFNQLDLSLTAGVAMVDVDANFGH
jgi:hypothetical protein